MAWAIPASCWLIIEGSLAHAAAVPLLGAPAHLPYCFHATLKTCGSRIIPTLLLRPHWQLCSCRNNGLGMTLSAREDVTVINAIVLS